jgi:hypothetical protein
MKSHLMILVALLTVCSASHAEPQYAKSNIRDMLFKALDQPESAFRNEVQGRIADKIKSTTKSKSPVIATVVTIKRTPKIVNCSLLNLHLEQANVIDASGKPIEFSLNYRIDLCKGDAHTMFD